MYDGFGMVAVVVLPDVCDGGEGRGGRRGEDGGDGVRLWRLQYLLLHVALCLGTTDTERETEIRQSLIQLIRLSEKQTSDVL